MTAAAYGRTAFYKDLEPGKSVEGADSVGREAAEEEITASVKRLANAGEAV
ncbi:inorganic pyrophosphatase [Streptomyces canus]|uniref:Inorganic pyrophosphatase n=1 Tax=Streptomyces canus TaxID=58343 RepID=A0AAW8FTU4_9ACTN|nr:inorganic pyrophosphatase [Streptomyces canus]MDQ1073394.1 inorganic pyrophosphatase [Streptomyces canus]